MDLTTLIIPLTPLMVYLVTQLVVWLKPKISGVVLVSIIVPILSAGLTALTYYSGLASINEWIQFAAGLLAVFISELIKQAKQGLDQSITAKRNQ